MVNVVRSFYTDGKRGIHEYFWNKPEPTDHQIEVKSILTGVCRSDIDMYDGKFQLLPKTIQGHESVGMVTKVGKNIHDVKEGDFVASRGEPAFADYYNCTERMYVKVPVASPEYIIEPVACGLNIANSLHPKTSDDILILGSGFLATIVHTSLRRYYQNKIYIVGNANIDHWNSQSHTILVDSEYIRNKHFKYIIDLSDKPGYLNLNIYAERAIIVMAAEKYPSANTTFAEFLWNAVDMKFPSPRNETFYESMQHAVTMIKNGDIQTKNLWTKEYDRDTEVKLAFEEGLARPPGYSRGYIRWKN